MSKFFVSYRENKKPTEFFCAEAANAIEALNRFQLFCEENKIEPISFRITKMSAPES